jgi:glycerophosphoryl diester phosphodiesterase
MNKRYSCKKEIKMPTKIFAHRGASKYAPENTMAAFYLAQKMNADGIELDVQLTKDGIPVVIHDENVKRTTNGKGSIKDYLLEDLKKLDAGVRFSTYFKGEKIPTLEDVLKWICTTNMELNIELKNNLEPYDGLEEAVIQLVKDYRMENKVVYSSFNHYSLRKIAKLNPNAEIAVLYHEKLYKPWKYVAFVEANSAHPNHKMLNDEILAGYKKHDIKVRPYTVNNPTKMTYFFQREVEGIITDIPDVALSIKQGKTAPKVNFKSKLFKGFKK